MIATCRAFGPISIWVPPAAEELDRMEQEWKTKRETAKEILLREMPPPKHAEVGYGHCHWLAYDSAQGKQANSLWAHAYSRYVFQLEKQWKTFKTQYCLNECNLAEAGCVFIVKGDDKELFRSAVVQDHVIRPLEVDVENVELLELIVEPQKDAKWNPTVWLTPIARNSVVVKEPVKFNAVKLRVALQSILGKQKLTYVIKNEVLLITSEGEMKRQMRRQANRQ